MKLDIQGALEEMLSKGEGQIQRETAHKWAARAVACYRIYAKTRQVYWALRAEEYRHEAIEHAAVAEDDCRTLLSLQETMDSERASSGL